jgi:hypothetical protein
MLQVTPASKVTMKPTEAILAVALAILLAGCTLRGAPKTAQAAPAPPKPVAVAAPAPPPQSLSIPQTQVELAPPQPISDEARATTDPVPEEPPPVTAAPKPPRNRAAQTPAAPAPTAPIGPPAPEPAAEVRPAVAPIVPAEELRQLQVDAERDRMEAKNVADRLQSRSLNHRQQDLKRNLESFLRLSLDAEKRGDMRQARELAGRARLLAKELQP